jgi:hypothetical protein
VRLQTIWLAETKNQLCVMRLGAKFIFVLEYLRKFKSIFETASVCEPGGPGHIICQKKTKGLKSRVAVHLRNGYNVEAPIFEQNTSE